MINLQTNISSIFRPSQFVIALWTIMLSLGLNSSAIGQPLNEGELQTLICAGIDDETVLNRIKKDGVVFNCDAPVLERIKKSGASENVLDCLRKLPADLTGIPYVADWGTFVDPVGDCKYETEKDGLTIVVPGAYHDVWPGQGKVNAPMVLQDVEGDFSFEVLVKSVTPAVTGTMIPELNARTAFHAGTLLVWQDDKNLIRFDRTNMNKDKQAITSCYFHTFQDGLRTAEQSQLVDDRPTHLRLVRKGNLFTGSYSQDNGVTWKKVGEKSLSLAAKVKIGVAVLNNTNLPCTVNFGSLTIGKK